MTEFIVKYGEISLKGANRLAFEQRLMRNIARRLPRKAARVRRTWGRVFLAVEDALADEAARALAATFGIVSYARVARFEKTEASFPRAADFIAAELAAGGGQRSFKVEASREDKQFGLNSYDIACLLGDLLRARLPGFTVDVRRPDATVRVEVRDHIYVYADQHRGPGGLPVGCSGRGLLLLSGGIDSPVAGYLMGGRGLAVDAVYFHAYPFTSAEAEQKVRRLAAALRRYLPNLALHVVPFTDVQVRIKEAARAAEITLLSRCAMMSIASALAVRNGHECLVTGESLGQVASQTVPSLHLTGSYATLPVMRPLIGHAKESIIAIAQRIGTFAISILPYPDCCTLFAPRHPVINPVVAELRQSFERLRLEDLMERSAAGTTTPDPIQV
ncbi:MAG: tRNA 4-thiouridine(8) synthase ThiI [Spirochaetaceae bacterium]|nr:tRNA 4-thiouridine(8) synthase ThiI [Spirochaetaceae bacterium]MDE0448003.1 tRNA 4-thiouridine(8) synthase ThiI [Spirochaetaceae bacterium]